tara:strand:+ start:1906 stop:2250 length:345 start_codon:yes stop_codon:yes gene_type:complete
MIYNGSRGSLNLYYKGLLISSFALTKYKTFQRYRYQGYHIIIESMKQGFKKEEIIITLINFSNIIYYRKKNKQSIRKSDHEFFLSCLFGLLKLKIIDNDESNGYFIMPRKKKIT